MNTMQRRQQATIIIVTPEEDGTPAVPEDMTATIADRATNEDLIKEVPCYNYFSLMGKDGPWKEVLAKHCRKALRSGSLQSWIAIPGQAYLDALIKMLQDAVLEVEQMDLQYWSANTGRNNLWYAGWRLMAWKYFVIHPCTKYNPRQNLPGPGL